VNTEYTAAIDQQQLNAPLFATAFPLQLRNSDELIS